MCSWASLIVLFLFSFLTSFRVFGQVPTYVIHVCPNTTTFSRTSTYFSNLEILLLSLSSPNASYSTRFQNGTVGESPDRVTGRFDCRGDVPPEVCRNCVAYAVKDALIRCPNERDVMLFYDECTLRYSNIIVAFTQDPSYIYHICPNMTTFSRNSTYFTNLRTLLSSLSSPFASYSTGFQNVTVGKDHDRITGLFLCRAGFSPEVCRSCVAFTVNETLYRCPDERAVTLYFEECMLRYSNENILSTLSTGGGFILRNSQNVSSNQLDRFRVFVASTMIQAANKAASSSRKFDARKAKFDALQSLYALVQCTPDLTRKDCLSCLQQSINLLLPTDKIGGIHFMQSCSSRYELYPFYNESAIRIPQAQPDSAPTLSPAPLILFNSPPPPISVHSPPPPISVPSRPPGEGGNSSVIIIAVVIPVTIIFLLFVAYFSFRTKRRRTIYETEPLAEDADDIKTAGSLQFDFRAIEAATDKFSESNKLGQGGFGQVYKGTFSSGVQVAVKRLSKTSGQGVREFENEVVVVAKLQHRNLVRLLGFCLEEDEKILVYEYVPNKSLDYFLFDSTMQRQLDWKKRYKIIGGIGRGILYFHQDSRLTIIHVTSKRVTFFWTLI